MDEEFKRTSNSFFNNFQQQANALQFDRSRNQLPFQQQSQGVVPQGYYPAHQNSRPNVSSPPFNASALSFHGSNSGNYGHYQSSLSGSQQWRSQGNDANSGLSSLAFASVLADGRSQGSPRLSETSSQRGSLNQQQRSNALNTNAQRSSATPSYSANTGQTRMPQSQPSSANNWARSQPRVQQGSSNQQASWQNTQWRPNGSASPINQAEQASNTSGFSTSTASQSMFVDPSQVYNAPPSQAPKSTRTVQHPQKDREVEQDSDEDSQSSVQIANEAPTKTPPQNKTKASSAKQTQKRTVDAGEARPPKKKARKTGSTMAPSSKRQSDTSNMSKTGASATNTSSLEAQMREMFMKMREFNSANPELLARLWQEERDGHVARTTAAVTQPTSETSQVVVPTESTDAPASKKKTPQAKRKSGATAKEPAAAKPTPIPAPPATANTNTPIRPSQFTPNGAVPLAGSGSSTTRTVTERPNKSQSSKDKSTPKSSTTKTDKSPVGKTDKKTPVIEAPVEPATKEDRAYKKTFADLVDLTMDSSEDESPMFSFQVQHAQGSDTPTQQQQPQEINRVPSTNSQVQPPLQQTVNVFPVNNSSRPFQPRIRARPPINITLAQPLDKYKAIRRSRYNPKTIARDVLLACGRHPDMRHLNEHLVVLKDTFPGQVDLSSDLSSIRWDLIDPGGLPTGSASIRPAPRVEEESSDESIHEAFAPLPRPKRQASPRPSDLSRRNGQRYVTPPASGLKLTGSRHPHTSRDASTMDSNTRPDSTSRRRGRPSAISSVAGQGRGDARGSTPSGYTALRAAQAERGGGAEQPKKRGRPVGWRKWMMKEGTGYATNKAPAEQAAPEPFYHIYKCLWSGCSAELHNLDTLRKHVSRVHEQTPPLIRCLWSDCGKPQPSSDPSSGRVTTTWARLKFDTEDKFKSHLEKAHISPIAWKFGDGPTGGISDHHVSDASETYNSDSQGRSVTPQIQIPSESAREALHYERNILSGGRIPKKSPEERARDVLKAVEGEKRAIGPGIDRGGARFANEKRRMGFVDDNDSEITIDEDD